MIKINNKSVIYVVCPSNVATGGPELLHQLVYKLNNFGYTAKMVYIDNSMVSRFKTISKKSRHKNPVHPFYEKYNNPVSNITVIKDDPSSIVVIPEVYTSILYMFKKATKLIWWLSVDNYYLKQENNKHKIKELLSIVKTYNFKDYPNTYHLAQSEYAVDFLKKKDIAIHKIGYLSDYLNNTYLESAQTTEFKTDQREDCILYNPNKGFEITTELMQRYPDYKWIPIQKMTPEEVKQLLLKSKVYIDFGNHPGKDRFPREAAICGCCVITGKRGAANFFEDVFIIDTYKFENPIQEHSLFKETIDNCFTNYETVICDFEDYRKRILAEEARFESDIKAVFEA